MGLATMRFETAATTPARLVVDVAGEGLALAVTIPSWADGISAP